MARPDGVGGPELERVEPGRAAPRRLVAVVGDDRPGEVRAVVAKVRDRVKVAIGDLQPETPGREVPVKRERLRVEEVQLRRVIEVAGMIDYCDFIEKESTTTDEGGRLTPDLIIRHPNGKTLVVDSKVPIEA